MKWVLLALFFITANKSCQLAFCLGCFLSRNIAKRYLIVVPFDVLLVEKSPKLFVCSPVKPPLQQFLVLGRKATRCGKDIVWKVTKYNR